MSTSLHAAAIGSHLQILAAIAGLLDKAEAHCREHDLPAEDLLGARLAEDMWPFAKQVTCAIQHSAGAVEGVRRGLTGPDLASAPLDFATLRGMLAEAMALLQAVEPAEIDGIADRDMRFEFGDFRMEYTVSDYLLSFALPNFYFHASMAYAILRSRGLAVGKRDFLGRPRVKG
jgi:hypothetical protein